MTIDSIITPMNFSLVQSAICQMLANERDNQIELAESGGATDEWINQSIDFTIFPKRFRVPDYSEMPCVYIYFDEMSFPENQQDAFENYALANLSVDYFAVGKNEIENGKIIKTADENADDRLNYMTAQIYKTFCAESNIKNATNDLVRHSVLRGWKRIATPDDDNTAATVLGAQFNFELGFDEPTYYSNTIDVHEFFTSLHISDEYISPLVKIILVGNQ